MCELCQAHEGGTVTLAWAVTTLAEINTKIQTAQEKFLTIATDIRHDGNAELQAEAALQAIEDLRLEAIKASEAIDCASSAWRVGSQFGELDALTALPNRHLLMDRLNQGIAAAKREDKRLAVLFVDLDDFKSINDSYGHAAGDAVLKHVAACLTRSVRQVDTVSRIGGDEFVVLLTNIGDPADAALAAEKILGALRDGCELGHQVFHLGASVGISIYPMDGMNAVDLIARADEAMYRAKRSGLGRFSF